MYDLLNKGHALQTAVERVYFTQGVGALGIPVKWQSHSRYPEEGPLPFPNTEEQSPGAAIEDISTLRSHHVTPECGNKIPENVLMCFQVLWKCTPY